MAADGLPLLLVAGTLCDDRLWHAHAPVLAQRREVQPVAWRDERDIATLAERILAEAPPRFAIAGMSMGGSIALEVCARGAGRVAGLAMIDAHPWADPPARFEARQAQLAFARQHGLAALVREQLWPHYVHPARRGDTALLALVQAMAEGCGLAQFERQSALLASRQDRMGALHALPLPVLVAAGRDDVLCPAAWQAAMAEGLVDGQLALLDGCGHFALLEDAAGFQTLLDGWLQRCG